MTRTPPPLPHPHTHHSQEATTAFRATTVGAVPSVNSDAGQSSVSPTRQPQCSLSPTRQPQSSLSPTRQPQSSLSPTRQPQSSASPTRQHQQNQLPPQQLDSLPVNTPKNKSVSPTKPPRQLNLQQKFSPQLNHQQPQGTKPQVSSAVEVQQKNHTEPSSTLQQQQQQQQRLSSPERHQQTGNSGRAVDVVLEDGGGGVQAWTLPSSDARQTRSPSSPGKSRGMNGSAEDMEMVSMERGGAEPSPRKGKKVRRGGEGGGRGGRGGSSKSSSNPDTQLIEDMNSRGHLAPNGNSSTHNSLTRSAHELYSPSESSDPVLVGHPPPHPLHHSQHDLDDSFSEESGPHREMAIDCPDGFVATAKTPPRYPPPPHHHSSTSVSPSSTPSVPPTTPSKHADVASRERDRARTDAVLSNAALTVSGGGREGSSQPQPSAEQLERLRKHQEELRRRREEENRQQQEQDFLRTSLRGSKKLQALENRRMHQGASPSPPPPATGIVNTAFVDAEEDEEGGVGLGVGVGEEDEEEGELVDDVDAVQAAMAASRTGAGDRYLKKNPGVDDLLDTLQHVRGRLSAADNTVSTSASGGRGSTQELLFLKQLFHHPRFQRAVSMHHTLVDVTARCPQPCPASTQAAQLGADLCGDHLHPAPGSASGSASGSGSGSGSEAAVVQELKQLLSQPDLKNLLKAHDGVAEGRLHPALDSSDSDLIDFPLVQYGEESVKIIHLEKTTEHLGATVKNEGDSVIIARIVNGGAAEKSGLLHEGDELLEVNGIEMRGKNVNEVSDILVNMSGTITFMIIPAHVCVEDNAKPGEIMHLRALFNYDPEEDEYLPCRELGLSFLKGDVLHAVQLSDPNWWQAHRDGEDDHMTLAGLIPSSAFHTQRETIRQQLNAEGKENKKRSRVCACGRKERKKKKKKKALYNGGVAEEGEEILTYEEVARYYPQPNRKRPVVLVGPPDIGRQELRERIMESDFDRFAAAVPHTSRPPQAGEHHGKDYYFVSRSSFEADMLGGQFIECGEFQGHLYGTSVQAVRQVVTQGRICILNLGPESLKVMRDTDLKPYIIFVIPPNMEKLRQLQMALGKPRPTDDQLKAVMDRGRELEESYSHLFDFHLVNTHMDRSLQEILAEINRIEREPQWVPLAWVNNYM